MSSRLRPAFPVIKSIARTLEKSVVETCHTPDTNYANHRSLAGNSAAIPGLEHLIGPAHETTAATVGAPLPSRENLRLSGPTGAIRLGPIDARNKETQWIKGDGMVLW